MLLARILSRMIKFGRLTVVDADGRVHHFGSDEGGPTSTIRLHKRALHTTLAIDPKLYFGEAYMDGLATVEDGTIRDCLELIISNIARLEPTLHERMQCWLQRLIRPITQHNPPWRARKNVAHHYDLSDTLYDVFLDSDKQYSCAYFESPDDSLEQAQDAKKRHIAAKLLLKPGQKVLDIGSGWGGLGIYLAQVAGVDVTGVTLSEEQHKISRARAGEAGLDDRVRFHLSDYREQTGQFDRIVSVGMFEHIGVKHYGEFFAKLTELLADDGVALLHTIGRSDEPGVTENKVWMRKYIFPGGHIPALSEVLPVIERAGLIVTDIEVLHLHYAETLKAWYQRFTENRDKVAAVYDERFCRMWEYYLTAAEMSFRYWHNNVFHIQLAKRVGTVPLTRDYIRDWEQAHRRTAAQAMASD